jgi:light-regulated signal transduction histidine kinase (bacteriophytochrome)
VTPVSDAIAAALRQCEREPIHIPGSIQPHGVLLAFQPPDFIVRQASVNAADCFCRPFDQVLGAGLEDLFGAGARQLRTALSDQKLDSNPAYLMSCTLPDASGRIFQLIAHSRNGLPILELEETDVIANVAFSSVYPVVTRFMSDLAPARSLEEMNSIAAREIRRITGFDRVLIYRFDADWNGTVVAENRNEELPSYLDLRFPASDIPAQARELYRQNRLRLIADAGYIPVRIVPERDPATGMPLDLTFSVLRSVSPVHVEYMKNMGVAASMSISILREGALWGLVSCHHKRPRRVSFEIRNACDIIAQALSAQIAAGEHRADAESRIRLKSTQTRLLGHMAEEDAFLHGLVKNPEDLLACTAAEGAAILYEGQCRLVGSTPSESQVRELARWIEREQGESAVFFTDSLPVIWPHAVEFAAAASGVIAASISSLHDSYLMWFRPEAQRTVKWGGDPRKPTDNADGNRLSPRHSFEMWKETVLLSSRPWSASEVDSARDLREAIVRIVLRNAEEMAQLNAALTRSNQELEAFSYSVSHDLRAPFRHIVGFAELLRERESGSLSESGKRYVRTIIESAHFAGMLVDNLLSFSQIGRASLQFSNVDTAVLVGEMRGQFEDDLAKREIEWRIGALPRVRADLFMLRLVFQNLISNAIKYTRPREKAVIEIGSKRGEGEVVFFVRDNGVGFDVQYASKLFGIFQRLHRMEDFEGTGIGLANVRRIVGRHGGRTWAEGEVDRGAVFYFTLPDSPEARTQAKTQ